MLSLEAKTERPFIRVAFSYYGRLPGDMIVAGHD